MVEEEYTSHLHKHTLRQGAVARLAAVHRFEVLVLEPLEIRIRRALG